jgi:hypothetical protein
MLLPRAARRVHKAQHVPLSSARAAVAQGITMFAGNIVAPLRYRNNSHQALPPVAAIRRFFTIALLRPSPLTLFLEPLLRYQHIADQGLSEGTDWR